MDKKTWVFKKLPRQKLLQQGMKQQSRVSASMQKPKYLFSHPYFWVNLAFEEWHSVQTFYTF